MKSYAYKEFIVTKNDKISVLNQNGSEGWRLVSETMDPVTREFRLLLEIETEDTNAEP